MEDRREWRSILDALAKFDSALVANTLDAINLLPTHEIYMSGDIHSLTPTLGTRVGLAATCKVDTSTPGGKSNLDLYWRQLEAIEAAEAPMIWVAEAVGERPEHECVMGDGMAKTFCSVGCRAVVTGARVRDVEGMLGASFAAYARGTCIHHCSIRYKEINSPVRVGGIAVSFGDIIHASHEGVIKIPVASAERLLVWVPKMQAFENAAHEILHTEGIALTTKRKRVDELRREYGFE